MSIEIVPYSDQFAAAWDEWCESACNSTFLHTRQFLSYHRDRFVDASVLFFESNRIVGVMPAAHDNQDDHLIISHPGATYGGLVHNGWLSGDRLLTAFDLLREYYRAKGADRLIYKPVPFIYSSVPSQDDLYALSRANARCVRRDLSCTIDLSARRATSERRQRGLRKATKLVTLVNTIDNIGAFWRVLEENLQRKHQANPVHSLSEIALLIERFPTNIRLRCALIDDQVEAGVLLFCSQRVWHAQYIASSAIGYEASALDAVMESAIADAGASGMRYFDFGTSNENAGLVLNDGLYRFKSEFGGGGVVQEYFEMKL